MRLLLEVLLIFFAISRMFCAPLVKFREKLDDPDDRGVLPNIDGLYCANADFRQAVYSALNNVTDPATVSVDQIQMNLENTLMPQFKSLGGTWLVSVTTYHRVNGYVDDSAIGMNTFCAVNSISVNLYIIIMKIDN